MKSTQNLSLGRFRHAETESEVKNLRISHPDLEMKENDLQNVFLLMRSSGYSFLKPYFSFFGCLGGRRVNLQTHTDQHYARPQGRGGTSLSSRSDLEPAIAKNRLLKGIN